HRGGQTRGRAAAAAARPLRAVARAAHRPGAHGARDRADPARRRGARHRGRGGRVPALQPRGGRGEGARGDPPRQPRREHRADRRDAVAASHEPARDPGGALAVAGVAFQALTRNPLAEPSVLGISGGAAFGVVIGQSFGLGLTVVEAVGLTGFAFAGALLAAAAVYLIAAVGRAAIQIQTLLLAGVIVGIFFASAITVIISLLDFNRLGGVIHWLLGNLAPIPPGALGLFALLLAAGFGLVLSHARELNL